MTEWTNAEKFRTKKTGSFHCRCGILIRFTKEPILITLIKTIIQINITKGHLSISNFTDNLVGIIPFLLSVLFIHRK